MSVQIKKNRLYRSLTLLAVCSSSLLLGLSPRALSQTTTSETTVATQGAVQPRLVDMLIPDLPPLRDASPYLPSEAMRIVLKLGERRVYLYRGSNAIASYPVAVGKSGTPTPTGEFAVFEMVVNPSWQSPWTGDVETPGADGSLGLRWIGFARMPGGVIGFHGTPRVSSIGQAVSHGCVRLRNEDVVALFSQIKLGTPVTVEP
jgi:hypothetical protein